MNLSNLGPHAVPLVMRAPPNARPTRREADVLGARRRPIGGPTHTVIVMKRDHDLFSFLSANRPCEYPAYRSASLVAILLKATTVPMSGKRRFSSRNRRHAAVQGNRAMPRNDSLNEMEAADFLSAGQAASLLPAAREVTDTGRRFHFLRGRSAMRYCGESRLATIPASGHYTADGPQPGRRPVFRSRLIPLQLHHRAASSLDQGSASCTSRRARGSTIFRRAGNLPNRCVPAARILDASCVQHRGRLAAYYTAVWHGICYRSRFEPVSRIGTVA